MLLAVRVGTTDDYHEIPVGLVDITPALASNYVKLIEFLVRSNTKTRSIYTLDRFDYNLQYFEGLDSTIPEVEEVQYTLENTDFVKVQPKSAFVQGLDDKECRAELNLVRVYTSGIRWEAVVKHTSIELWTGEIPLSLLRRIARSK